MPNWELKWKKDSFALHKHCEIYRLTGDMLIARVAWAVYDDGALLATIVDKHGSTIKRKNFKVKKDMEPTLTEAKNWAESQMLLILEKNVQALRGE